MTARLCYKYLLTELNKVNAPSILLEDFNYFINKTISQYTNKRYNIYDVNLQTTDDLRALKSTALITDPQYVNELSGISTINDSGISEILKGTYYINLPLDYLHILNCICIYKVKGLYKCYNTNDKVLFAAKRLTSDSWPVIMNDYYNRPLPERPYYCITNVNSSNDLPTNPILDSTLSRKTVGNDVKTNKDKSLLGLPRTISLSEFNTPKEDLSVSTVDRKAGVRYGNPTAIRCEIRCGLNTPLELIGVLVDYLKTPQTICLTQDLINLIDDTSQILEFPDYGCQEIINELTSLVLENTLNPRLQTHNAVTLSIENPAQQLTPNLKPMRWA